MKTSWEDVYAFDQSVSGILELIPDDPSKDTFYILVPDVHRGDSAKRINWKDWVAILASTLKLIEVFALWKRHALKLCIISGGSWAYFVCASAIIQAAGLSREISRRASERELDLLAGPLPTPVKAGGQCKILLGAPHNVRRSRLWRVAWALGSIVSVASIITAYMTLSSQDSQTFAIWAGFQAFWLVLRSAFYHFAENTDRVFQHPILLKKRWAGLSTAYKARARGLVEALSLYQMHVHPRGFYSYDEDDRLLRDIYSPLSAFPLSADHRGNGTSTTIFIAAVLGDTLLASASFIIGRSFAPLDFYDTCVVIIRTKEGEIAIPAARVVSGTPPPRDVNDIETGLELPRPPRASGNRGKWDLTWWYWIPCDDGTWLEMHTTDLGILGERRASIVTGAAITKHLISGELHVSISEVGHVEEILANSRLGFEAVQSLLR